MSRIKNYEKGRLNIENELNSCYNELREFSKAMEEREILVVASNHPFFIDRYVETGGFLNEPWNGKIALKLALAKVEGKDPVEEGIKMMGEIPKNVRFLKLREDYKVCGYQLASHGHKGLSGARGSVRGREIGHGQSITGHTHAPEILRDTYIVGTSTRLDLPYTEGSSSAWMPANAVLYEDGLVQLIPIIMGYWTLDNNPLIDYKPAAK
jgi:hypothetical protein